MNLATQTTEIKAAPTTLDLISEFLQWQDIKPASKSTYRRAIRQFLDYIGLDGLNGIESKDIIRYKEHLKSSGKSPYTVSNYLAVVRIFFDWTESRGYCPNIAKRVKGAKAPKGFAKDSLSVFEAQRLLDMETTTDNEKRDFALINLILRLGLRTVEVARANIGDIRREQGELVLYLQGKGQDSKDSYMKLEEDVLTPLYDYLATRTDKSNPNAPLFITAGNRNKGGRLTTRSISRIVKNRLIEIGIDNERITAHSLRHTAITFVLLAGGTLQEAQTLARHSKITTTQIYAHNIDRIKNAPERYISKLLKAPVRVQTTI